MGFITSFFAVFIGIGVIQASQNDHLKFSTEIQRARTIFNDKLLSFFDKNSKGNNQLLSTFGLHSVLSSVLDGAENETFDQLWEALG